MISVIIHILSMDIRILYPIFFWIMLLEKYLRDFTEALINRARKESGLSVCL
jgi:hypothetical protein